MKPPSRTTGSRKAGSAGGRPHTQMAPRPKAPVRTLLSLRLLALPRRSSALMLCGYKQRSDSKEEGKGPDSINPRRWLPFGPGQRCP